MADSSQNHSEETKEAKRESQEGVVSFSIQDGSDSVDGNEAALDSSNLRKVMANLRRSSKCAKREDTHNRNEMDQEERYRMRIRSFPSDDTGCIKDDDDEEKDEDEATKIKASQRVSAGSKVNYIFLNEAEQVERYKNTRAEYLALKKELAQKEKDYYATYGKTQGPSQRRKGLSKADSMLLEAHDKLKGQKFEEHPECENVLQNLAGCLASGALKGDSVELGLICNLVRKMKMGISSQEGLSLMTRANSFLKTSKREEIVSYLSGGEVPVEAPIEKPTPIYSFVPFQLQQQHFNGAASAFGRNPQTLSAQITGSRVTIPMTASIQETLLSQKVDQKHTEVKEKELV